jgi:hypothetical protein
MTRSTENPQFLRGLSDNQRSLAISSTRRPPAKAPKQPEPIASHKQNSGIAARTPSVDSFLSTNRTRQGSAFGLTHRLKRMLSFLDAPSPKIPRGGVCYVAKDIKAALGQSVACCDREPIKKAPPGGVG